MVRILKAHGFRKLSTLCPRLQAQLVKDGVLELLLIILVSQLALLVSLCLLCPLEPIAGQGWSVGTLADYFGIPTGVAGLSVSALPFRAYALIMNEWFRDQNLQDPLVVPTDDSTVAGVNTGTLVTDVAKGGKPFIAAKYHDYFTSALPSPQKGPDVTIPAATSGQYPVVGLEATHDPGGFGMFGRASLYSGGSSYIKDGTFGTSAGQIKVFDTSDTPISSTGSAPIGFEPTNLWAQSSGGIGATINQLRLAFQIQKFYEQQARGGSRYTEVVRSFFGVMSPDARLQRPEYLGGNRVPINVNQIVQQSGTESSGTPQGTVVGQSLTTDKHSDFTKSFTEHGLIIGVMVARYDHTYQQGLNRLWSRKDKFDFYWPVFANIGEQAIKNKEIFAQGNDKDNEVFGYQEAWAEYRYKPNMVTGEMRSAYAQSLDVWHLADDYSSLPSLSDSWIREDKANIDRVLAVTSAVSNQFFADIYVKNYCTRPMPMYSVPGLIDHH
nr:MAG TPA: Major capsid protein [Microviridae sp.]